MRNLLIVEDDYYIRDIYLRTFVKAGYGVDVAADGEEGVTKGESKQYDLILLDIMLPKITGIDVLRVLRTEGKLNHKTPIYLITNLGQEEIIKQAFILGADGYLIKSQLRPHEILHEVEVFFQQRDKTQPPAPVVSVPPSVPTPASSDRTGPTVATTPTPSVSTPPPSSTSS